MILQNTKQMAKDRLKILPLIKDSYDKEGGMTSHHSRLLDMLKLRYKIIKPAYGMLALLTMMANYTGAELAT